MSEIFSEWLHSALMDLRSVEKIIDDPFLTPVACFHAQQCVEKTFKAILEKEGNDVPKTHDIVRLYGLIESRCMITVDINLLQKIGELYIETRYPGDFGLLPEGKPSLEETKTVLLFARDVYDSVLFCLENKTDS